MRSRTLFVAFALVLGCGGPALATPYLFSPACTTGTLASYIALGGGPTGGCSIDTEVRFFDFSFTVLSTGGGAIPISAASITVTPVLNGADLSLTFSSAGFSVSGAESVSYLLAYTIDPHPILKLFRDNLLTSTPTFPGLASITTNLCIGAPFGGTLLAPTCSGTPDSVMVFHNGTTFSLSDSTSFAPVADLGVRNIITLAANGATSSFTGLTNTVQVTPEPVTLLMMGTGLLGLGLSRRRLLR
jgi:PEP-CTERM motif-containing protein